MESVIKLPNLFDMDAFFEFFFLLKKGEEMVQSV